jgi:hypothetical protein
MNIEQLLQQTMPSTGGCLLFTGATDKAGYGALSIPTEPPCSGYLHKGKWRVLAHRLAWALVNGPIPKGHYICHRCDTPGCINPTHLFLGTPADNTHDAIAKGRITPAKAACHKGHREWSGPPGAKRRCLACHRLNQARYRSRAKSHNR